MLFRSCHFTDLANLKLCQAMYPSLILIIVNKERSIVNTFGFSMPALGSNLNGEDHPNGAEHRSATMPHFAVANLPAGTMSTVDNERSLSTRHSAIPANDGPGSSINSRSVV